MQRFVLPNNDTISLKKRTSLKSKITKKLFSSRKMAFVRSTLSQSVYLLNLFVMSLITRVVMLLKRLQRSIVMGEQGGRSGESTHLLPMWPGFESWRWRRMWVEFVVGSLPCSERLFSGFSGFPPTFPNSNSIWSARTRFNELSAPWVNKLQIIINYPESSFSVRVTWLNNQASGQN